MPKKEPASQGSSLAPVLIVEDTSRANPSVGAIATMRDATTRTPFLISAATPILDPARRPKQAQSSLIPCAKALSKTHVNITKRTVVATASHRTKAPAIRPMPRANSRTGITYASGVASRSRTPPSLFTAPSPAAKSVSLAYEAASSVTATVTLAATTTSFASSHVARLSAPSWPDHNSWTRSWWSGLKDPAVLC